MPNWCHNTLEVSGSNDDIVPFVNRARRSPDERDQPLFFSNFIPEPEYDESQNNAALPDWWSWRIVNWGTKWEPNFEAPFMALGSADSDPGMEKNKLLLRERADGEMFVTYEFDTAWSPPIPVVRAASEQHPNLHFRLTFGEPGGGYGGELVVAGGVIIHEEEGEASGYLPPEKMWF
jgi:hypothetical protein